MFQKNVSIPSDQGLTNLAVILFGVALLFGCSQVSIPLQPVPITLQTLGVIFIILTYDAKKAIQTMVAYVVLGALGFPVFSGYSGGINIILGATGGYILGFVLASFVVIPFKKLLNSYNSIVNAFVLSVIATLTIMVSGLFWLSFHVGLSTAIKVGFMPFIIPGLIKSGILSLILRSIGYFKRV